MSQATLPYKRSLSHSVGAGVGSLFNGGGKTYFVLEHKVSSRYHKAGEAQEIIVDQVELGRDSTCAVRFDDSFKTVSRRHAAIVRDGDNWKLVQLSKTNSTFLNGHPVQTEWYLQNGDEIQLAVNGPKLGFIVPTGNKSTVGSIGLSRRLSLFRQQALRPYKTAMWSLAGVLLLVIGLGTWVTLSQKKVIEDQGTQITELVTDAHATAEELARVKQESNRQIDEMNARNQQMERELASAKKRQQSLEKQLKELSEQTSTITSIGTPHVSSGTTNSRLAACEPQVYFVLIRRIDITYAGESLTLENVGTGSGFLLDDGRFVTARHVVEPWMYPESSEDKAWSINGVAHNGGRVVCHLEAYSPNGTLLRFTSTNAVVDRSSDKRIQRNGVDYATPEDGTKDWAYFRTNRTGGLTYNNGLSSSLPVQAQLTVLGYPMGIGANSPTDIHPIYSQAIVARQGLERGYILTTASTFEHGNSGGPVFATSTDGSLIVVGLVSAGAGRSTGLVVPISAVNNASR